MLLIDDATVVWFPATSICGEGHFEVTLQSCVALLRCGASTLRTLPRIEKPGDSCTATRNSITNGLS